MAIRSRVLENSVMNHDALKLRQELAEAVSAGEMMVKILKLDQRWREEGRWRTAGEVAHLTAFLTDRFQTKGAHCLLSETRQAQKWQKPQSGQFKVNTDGAYDSDTGSGGRGFIIRDDHGIMVKAGVGGEVFLQNAFHAELLGCVAGLREAAKLRLNRVCLEIDATAVKTAIDGDDRLSALGGIITELKLLPFSEFASWSVCVCPHSCNKTADAIAAYGCRSSSGFRVLWDVVPQFIELW